MLNVSIIEGRICHDLELKHTPTGTEVLSFLIASERDFKDKDGNKQSDFVDVAAFGSTAAFVHKYFAKGRKIVVQGKLRTRTWQDKDGNERKTTEIKADAVYFSDSKTNQGNAETATESETAGFMDVAVDGDLPF